MTEPPILSVFVYGTLKRGQIREQAWPHLPTSIVAAKVRGQLFDLGEFPALMPGDDWVAGEIWTLHSDHMQATLEILDEIEGYRNSPSDLYKRVVVDCHTRTNTVVHAYVYFYTDTNLSESCRIPSMHGMPACWPPSP